MTFTAAFRGRPPMRPDRSARTSTPSRPTSTPPTPSRLPKDPLLKSGQAR